jgi:hypothetical protein
MERFEIGAFRGVKNMRNTTAHSSAHRRLTESHKPITSKKERKKKLKCNQYIQQVKCGSTGRRAADGDVDVLEWDHLACGRVLANKL